MCGISGFAGVGGPLHGDPRKVLSLMNALLQHRGPDEEGCWVEDRGRAGLASRRLSIIDLETGQQPMTSDSGCVIVHNGAIYNHIELRSELGEDRFRTNSDTEVILRAYEAWGTDCFSRLRGMFALAIWDPRCQQLVCARDRFGIKPFYYVLTGNRFLFASEAKALLPFLPSVQTNLEALKEYLVFQFCLGEKTLFQDIHQLPAAHYFIYKNDRLFRGKYWELSQELDREHTESYFQDRLLELLEDSVKMHLRSDVPVSVYLSGGLDSSLVAVLSNHLQNESPIQAITGRFSISNEFDESPYARAVAREKGFPAAEIDITSSDFIEVIRKVIYYLDYPEAGPGAFPHYMVSRLASTHGKVVLGGLGGDEIFGGYVRYLIAHLGDRLEMASDDQPGYVDSAGGAIYPDLSPLRNYGAYVRRFLSEDFNGEDDRRYFHLINRAGNLKTVIDWGLLEHYSVFSGFKDLFCHDNGRKESFFERMMRFDFHTLLPALLHVEDRMSMAHGLESRVPLLDHPVVELLASIPPEIKLGNGRLKHLLKSVCKDILPEKILNRGDKMGFPVPLSIWMEGELHEFVYDILNSRKARQRPYLNPGFDPGRLMAEEGKFDRRLWGLLCLELWQSEFHDTFNSKRQGA